MFGFDDNFRGEIMPNATRRVSTSTQRASASTRMPQQVRALEVTRWFLWCFTIAISSCTGPSTGGTPAGSVTPSPVQPVFRDSIPSTHLANLFHPGRVVYDLAVRSVIESIVGDSNPRIDSSYVNSVVSAEFTADVSQSQIQAVVHIDSTRLTTSPGQPRYFGAVQYTFAISQSGQIQNTSTPSRVCGMEPDNPITGAEILPRFPVTSLVTELWRDTTAYELCRGSVLLQARRVATYRRVTSYDATSGSQFIRQSHLTFTGRGNQWGQPVEATGSGDSVDTLTLSSTPPRLTRITGSGRLELRFASQFRSQTLQQISQLQIQLRP